MVQPQRVSSTYWKQSNNSQSKYLCRRFINFGGKGWRELQTMSKISKSLTNVIQSNANPIEKHWESAYFCTQIKCKIEFIYTSWLRSCGRWSVPANFSEQSIGNQFSVPTILVGTPYSRPPPLTHWFSIGIPSGLFRRICGAAVSTSCSGKFCVNKRCSPRFVRTGYYL